MGYMMAYSMCYGCKRDFFYHPSRVPSVRVNGHREPICQDVCGSGEPPAPVANGLEPIVPLPGAYEPADEHEV